MAKKIITHANGRPVTREEIAARFTVPAIQNLDGDAFTSALDSILDHSLENIFPFLTRSNVPELWQRVHQHIDTHLMSELLIVAGAEPDVTPSPTVAKLRRKFKKGRDANMSNVRDENKASNCAKCGGPISQTVEDKDSDGKMWLYCSEDCRDRH